MSNWMKLRIAIGNAILPDLTLQKEKKEKPKSPNQIREERVARYVQEQREITALVSYYSYSMTHIR